VWVSPRTRTLEPGDRRAAAPSRPRAAAAGLHGHRAPRHSSRAARDGKGRRRSTRGLTREIRSADPARELKLARWPAHATAAARRRRARKEESRCPGRSRRKQRAHRVADGERCRCLNSHGAGSRPVGDRGWSEGLSATYRQRSTPPPARPRAPKVTRRQKPQTETAGRTTTALGPSGAQSRSGSTAASSSEIAAASAGEDARYFDRTRRRARRGRDPGRRAPAAETTAPAPWARGACRGESLARSARCRRGRSSMP